MQGSESRQVADQRLDAGASAGLGTPTAGSAFDDDSLYPFYFGKDSGRQHGRLNRTLHSLNPFKRNKAGGGWFNPEDFTAQKREWAKQFSGDGKGSSENYKLFESFFIAGLPPTTDIKSVTANAQTTRTARHDHVHMRFAPETTKETEHRGYRGRPLDAQVLYSYPPDKPVSSEVASFCFPHGVQPVLLERTPSMSSLNEVIYGQRYLHSDASSFIFLMKVADNMPLYGVCCCMDELVHRPPAILSSLYPSCNGPLSRYLVAAPRCYCLLTHYPFFSLHMKVLHMIMGLERLERITGFTDEALRSVPESPFADLLCPPLLQPSSRQHRSQPGNASLAPEQHLANGANKRPLPLKSGKVATAGAADASRPSSGRQASTAEASGPRAAVEALAVAIKSASSSVPNGASSQDALKAEAVGNRPASFSAGPLSSRPTHRRAASAAGLPPLSPNSSGLDNVASTRLASSISRASARLRQVLDAKAETAQRISEDSAEASLPDSEQGVESSSDSGTSYRTARSNLQPLGVGLSGMDEPNSLSPAGVKHSSSTGALNRLASGSSPSEERFSHQRGDQAMPSPSGRSSDLQAGSDRAARNLLKSESLRSHLNAIRKGGSGPAGALQVMQAYYEEAVPQPGQEFEFSADDSLQPVHFMRPPLKLEPGAPEQIHRTQIANAEAEAAAGLRSWTIAVLCRCLSLDNILLLLTAVLLEQQMVLFCPNIGLLSTTVLSLIPLIRPFAWQSLLLPILPALDKMLDLLEAPVPFILGVQYKTSEVASRCSGLIRVNVYKDSIKNVEKLPVLPGRPALYSMLEPAYNTLRGPGSHNAHTRPTCNVTANEKSAAEDFLQTAEAYLSSLCAKLHLHTITDVQTADRVSLLMKDSFIESFPTRDRNFVRMFVETQMFSVYCDTVMA